MGVFTTAGSRVFAAPGRDSVAVFIRRYRVAHIRPAVLGNFSNFGATTPVTFRSHMTMYRWFTHLSGQSSVAHFNVSSFSLGH